MHREGERYPLLGLSAAPPPEERGADPVTVTVTAMTPTAMERGVVTANVSTFAVYVLNLPSSISYITPLCRSFTPSARGISLTPQGPRRTAP